MAVKFTFTDSEETFYAYGFQVHEENEESPEEK